MLKQFRAWLSHYDWAAIVGSVLLFAFIGIVLVPVTNALLAGKQADPHHCYAATAARGGDKEISCESIWVRTNQDPVALYTLVLAAFTIVLAGASIWQGKLTQRAV